MAVGNVCENSTEVWEDKDRRERVWLGCQAGILPARIILEKQEAPNKQLQQSLNELSLQTKFESEKEDKSIKHKGDIQHGDVATELRNREKCKEKVLKCDDIAISKSSKANCRRNEGVKPTTSGSKESETQEKELVKVQLEESGEILEIDRRFIEKVDNI